jgi:hypothetical protein
MIHPLIAVRMPACLPSCLHLTCLSSRHQAREETAELVRRLGQLEAECAQAAAAAASAVAGGAKAAASAAAPGAAQTGDARVDSEALPVGAAVAQLVAALKVRAYDVTPRLPFCFTRDSQETLSPANVWDHPPVPGRCLLTWLEPLVRYLFA